MALSKIQRVEARLAGICAICQTDEERRTIPGANGCPPVLYCLTCGHWEYK